MTLPTQAQIIEDAKDESEVYANPSARFILAQHRVVEAARKYTDDPNGVCMSRLETALSQLDAEFKK